jgi:hypothetical protein
LPESAKACAASADIAVERVTMAATSLANATPRFAANATITVRALSGALSLVVTSTSFGESIAIVFVRRADS